MKKHAPDGNGLRTIFNLRNQAIEVSAPDGKNYRITLTLDDDGNCKCRVNNKALDPWQVLRMVLEPVLFPAQ
jgi:hypothetical protein